MAKFPNDSKQLLGGDLGNILLLILLYCFQGVPLGLASGTLPFLLKKHLSYTQVGIFSLSTIPYSLKFLWSPMVDSYFVSSLGRRKSWIIPMQVISGVLMIYLSFSIDDMLADDSHIWSLAQFFLMLVIMVATQDIAVDGWALELLEEKNKSYASTCQSLGVTTGYFMSFTFLVAFNNPDFCNTYIFEQPQPLGLIQVSEYMYFWGVVFILASLAILLFVSEAPFSGDHEDLGFRAIYKQVYKILSLTSIKWLISVLLTVKLWSSAHDNAIGLELIDKGFPQASLASFAVLMLPVEILISLSIGWFSRADRLMKMFTFGFGVRLLSIAYGIVILNSYPDGPMTTSYYSLVLSCAVIHSIGSNCMFVSICAFFNQISDPLIGGTYITLLNTLHNFGSTWHRALILYIIDSFTEDCQPCTDCPPCDNDSNAFSVVSGTLLLLGIGYFCFLKYATNKLQQFPLQAWRTTNSRVD
jgi:hypothetical protein